jgi:hypothetical protein
MNKKSLHYILIIFCLTSLSSCSFSPVYKENHVANQFLSEIDIAPGNSPEGADFYNHLKNILPRSKNAKYILTTTYSFSKSISIIQKNSNIARESITIKIGYTLKDKVTDKQITSENFSRFASFNTTFSPYSNDVNQQDVHKNLAIMAAEEVRNRLMLFIKTEKTSAIIK